MSHIRTKTKIEEVVIPLLGFRPRSGAVLR